MKLALLKETQLNPWHLPEYPAMETTPEVTGYVSKNGSVMDYANEDLDALDINVVPVLPGPQGGAPWQRCWRFLARHVLRRPVGIPAVRSQLKEYDVLQSWELYSDWTAAALEARRKWGVPLCVEVWDNIPFALERNPVRRRRKERTAAESDLLLVHTEASHAMLQEAGVPETRIVRLDPGLDTTQYAPGARARQRYGLPLRDFVILLVEWLMPRKGMEFLLLALRELIRDKSLRKKRPIRLWVVGTGPGKARMKALARQLGVAAHCTFTDAQPYDTMPFVYRSADVFVMPGNVIPEQQEQCGMNVLEAMACGAPVISTQSGAIAELIEDAGILCPPDDVVALHGELKRFVQERAQQKKYAARGRKLALRRFSLPRYTAAMEEVLQTLRQSKT